MSPSERTDCILVVDESAHTVHWIEPPTWSFAHSVSIYSALYLRRCLRIYVQLDTTRAVLRPRALSTGDHRPVRCADFIYGGIVSSAKPRNFGVSRGTSNAPTRQTSPSGSISEVNEIGYVRGPSRHLVTAPAGTGPTQCGAEAKPRAGSRKSEASQLVARRDTGLTFVLFRASCERSSVTGPVFGLRVDDARWCRGPTNVGRGFRGFRACGAVFTEAGIRSRNPLALRASWVWIVVVRCGVGIRRWRAWAGCRQSSSDSRAAGVGCGAAMRRVAVTGLAMRLITPTAKRRSRVMFSGPWPKRMRLVVLETGSRCHRGCDARTLRWSSGRG